jgi:hypothetical protein
MKIIIISNSISVKNMILDKEFSDIMIALLVDLIVRVKVYVVSGSREIDFLYNFGISAF